MPRANIHIRNDNAEAWANIPNKSEWVNERLAEAPDTREKVQKNSSIATVDPPEQLEDVTGMDSRPGVIKTPEDAVKAIPKDVGASTCPAGHLLAPGTKKCSWKGCKYSK